MFVIERKKLLSQIIKIQRMACSYDNMLLAEPTSFCDCKYGIGEEGFCGERTGCPKLRNVTRLLEAMTDEEYEKFMEKGFCTII